MTYKSRSRSDFTYAFSRMLQSKFIPASVGLNEWRSISDFAQLVARSYNLDELHFYKSGTMLLWPIFRDLLGGKDLMSYFDYPGEEIILFIGPYNGLEARLMFNERVQLRVRTIK